MQAKVIAQLDQENYQTKISSGKHCIIADEPLALGGSDAGFTPYELLASSLASCTAITLRMYSSQKKWDLGQVSIQVEIHKDSENQGVVFLRTLAFENKSLDTDQLNRLQQVANKCPLHKVLSGQISIQTTLV